MSNRDISLDIDEDNLRFKIKLASYCYYCIDAHTKFTMKEDCEHCNNKRLELTDNGKKIIGLVLKGPWGSGSKILEDIDLKDLTDYDSRGYGYR